MNDTISPYKALDYIRDNAEAYAVAKASVVYLTEYRKTIKATLMIQSDAKTESAKESYAYAHEDYVNNLMALRTAIEQAECMRWKLIAAQSKIEVWRSLEASTRAEIKGVG